VVFSQVAVRIDYHSLPKSSPWWRLRDCPPHGPPNWARLAIPTSAPSFTPFQTSRVSLPPLMARRPKRYPSGSSGHAFPEIRIPFLNPPISYNPTRLSDPIEDRLKPTGSGKLSPDPWWGAYTDPPSLRRPGCLSPLRSICFFPWFAARSLFFVPRVILPFFVLRELPFWLPPWHRAFPSLFSKTRAQRSPSSSGPF